MTTATKSNGTNGAVTEGAEVQAPEVTAENAWDALAQMQGALPTVPLDKENPHFRSKFASLAGIMEAIRPVLCRYGFSWTAPPRLTDEGNMVIAYSLRWKDGSEVAGGDYPLPSNAKPQELGSAITYARRYAISAVLGIVADEDDDGNAAQSAAQKATTPAANRGTAAAPADAMAGRFTMLGNCPICEAGGWKSKSGKAAQMMDDAQLGERYCSGRTPEGRAIKHTEDDVRDFLLRQGAEVAGAAAEGGDIDPSEIPF